MTIQSKSYMNFLGGEVSPNVYKRLDMAGNGKWFETAKNIYFGTTGDIFNRRGFAFIDNSNIDNNAAIKLIPFVFNRKQAYCIEFGPSSFSILKNGSYLLDANNEKIVVQHTGMTLVEGMDISYVQTADILYLCSRNTNKIYSIARYAEDDWRWQPFEYEIPPMRSINTDKNKKISFEATSGLTDEGYFTVDLGFTTGTFVNAAVDVLINNTRTTVYTASSTLSSVDDLVTDFNSSIGNDSPFSHARANGSSVSFYVKNNSGFDNMSDLRIKIGSGSELYKSYDFGETYPDWYIADDRDIAGWQEYRYPVITSLTPSGSGYALVNPKMLTFKVRRFDKEVRVWLTPGDMPDNYTDYEYSYTSSQSKRPQDVLNDYYNDVSRNSLLTLYTFSGSTPSAAFNTRVARQNSYGEYILSMSMMQVTGVDTYYSASVKNYIVSGLTYNATATFNFFENKKVNDIFSLDCIYSPSVNGKSGENKTISTTLSTGTTITSPFWSNGTWRFVNSGLFAGTIEIQYSYDGEEWFTHRTYTSTIRTEGGVSYGTNYNEYGTIDADDNILLRLKCVISAATNLRVTLDTESYKSRSYYRIIEKDTTYPNTKAVVECIKYPIGTPGITEQDPVTLAYTYNSIYEWAESAWSEAYGFPKICFYYQNRLGFASTIKDPQVIWFSRTNNFNDFSTKVEYFDDDPITISALNSTGISDISWVSTAKKLFVFTSDYEYGIMDEGALTQANKQLINFTAYGSEEIEPRVISNRIIFVERGGRAARALVYDYTQENYEAVDLTIPYKHLLTDEIIVESEYIPGDYKTYLMLTSKGRILCFKYIPEQKIEACSWFKHAIGNIKNICIINNATSFDLYVSVETSSGKHLEYMHILKQEKGVYLDSFRQYVFNSAQTSITDASYFIPGQEYIVISDNLVYKVSAGENGDILLNNPSTKVTVGISYQSEATMIEPNLMFQNGTTNYNRKNMFKAHFEFIDSCGFQVGVKSKKNGFKKVYALEGQSVEGQHNLYSDSRSFALQSSYLEPNMLSFVQNEPYPMHIVNAEVEVDYGGK